MKISDVYDKYKIMPQLQMHMLRVAGVAQMICDNFEKPIDSKLITTAMLLHDMGNIVKFKLDASDQQGIGPLGLEYWQRIQKEFIEKYGPVDYDATYKILEEIGASKSVQNLAKTNEFAKMSAISRLENSFEQKICVYSDARVSPTGVVSLTLRLAEVKERWIKYKKVTVKFFDQLTKSAQEIEKQIFSRCKIKPEDITEEKVQELIPELRNFQIEI